MQVTVVEAARLLGISIPTVRRRLRTGELPGNQVTTPQGYVWMVEVPDDLPVDNPSSGEVTALRELITHLTTQIEYQQEEIHAKNEQIRELHVLLQQSQVALPVVRDNRSWWQKLWHRNGR
jgi:hypothetical protein